MDKDPKTGKAPFVSKLTAKGKPRGRPRRNSDGIMDMPEPIAPTKLETLDVVRAMVSVWSPQLENDIVRIESKLDPRRVTDPALNVGDVPDLDAASMRRRLARHRKELGLDRK